MDRRKFIKATTLSGLALAFAPQQLFSQKTKSWNSQLEYHKITSIKYADMHMRYPRRVGKNSRLNIHGFGPNLRAAIIRTNQGAEGFAEVRGDMKHVREKASQLIGRKITDVFDPSQGIISDDAYYFDLALHDLAGNILSIPCYEMFGQKQPITTKIYSGMIYFDDLDPEEGLSPMEQIAKNVAYDYEKGYRQFKIKIGRGAKWMEANEGFKRDVEVTRFIAEKYPDCEILVDANDGYTCNGFIRYLEEIKDIDLFWIEEPFLENEKDLRKLREWLIKNGKEKTLLADGEHDPDFDFVLELGRKKLLDVNLMDIHDFGFTRWRKYMPMMKEFGMLASPHAWGSFNKTIYTAHFAGGYGNTCTIEGVTCTSEHVDFGNYEIKNGLLIPPTGNGWGMKLKNPSESYD